MDKDLVKALRCIASSYEGEVCYSDKYNWEKEPSEKAMTCNERILKRSSSLIPCPYMQNNYGVTEKSSVGKLLIKAADELEAYMDLEEKGKLVKLPVTVGDCVYCVAPFCKGDNIKCVHRHYYCGECSLIKNNIHERKFSLDMVENIGKSVFLTQEEAEAALKKKGAKK